MVILTQDRPPPFRPGDEFVYMDRKPYVVLVVVRNGVPLPRSITGLPATLKGPYDEIRCIEHARVTATGHGFQVSKPWKDGEGHLHVQVL